VSQCDWMIILDNSQVDAVAGQFPAGSHVLSFAPDASIRLRARGHRVIDVESLLPAFSHARNALRLIRTTEVVARHLRESGLQPAEVEALRISSANLIAPVLLIERAMHVVNAERWTVVDRGKLCRNLCKEDALVHLSHELAPSLQQFTNTRYSAAHGWFANKINQIIQKRIGSRRSILHLDFGNKLPTRIANMISMAAPSATIVYARPPRRTMLDTAVRALKTLARHRTGGTKKTPSITLFRASARAIRPLKETHRPMVRTGNRALDRILNTRLAEQIPVYAREVQAGLEFASSQRPSVVVLDNLIFPATISAAMTFKQQGARLVMINHGTHSVPAERLSLAIGRFWAGLGRVTSPSLTDLVCKNPQTAELARQLGDEKKIHALSVYDIVDRAPRVDETFRIVLAGNFMTVRQHMPWATELPGEFLQSILEVAETVAQLSNVQLIIKMKAGKDGFPLAVLEKKLSEPIFAGTVQLDVSSALSDVLPHTDLLISNLSTVIEEALANRVPVLLHTWRRRYRHFPAQTKPPSPDQRAAVYGVKPEQSLADMLTGIMQSHRDPLKDEEVAGYVWLPTDLETREAFGSDLLNLKG